MEKSIQNNLTNILGRIESACIHANRKPEEVKLLMATNTVSIENIKITFSNHKSLTGDNKIEESIETYDSLKCKTYQNHLFRHLQTSKIKGPLIYDLACIKCLVRIL